jgi:Na+-driven multidrug efflux pump
MLLIALIPGFGLGNAASTLVGQNLGASKPERAERSAWWVGGYTAVYMTTVGVLLYAFARPLIAFFDPTSEVVAMGEQCLRIVAPSLVASAVGVVLARGLDGAGNTVPAMVINLLSLWGTEVPIAYGLSRWLGLGVTGVFWGRTVANLVNGGLFAYWFGRGHWKDLEV